MAFNMGQFADSMAPAPRTIDRVTDEIQRLKHNLAGNIMGIGARLNEAKEMLPHGEWLSWLEDSVQFSERTAQNFMRLAAEWRNPQALADLGTTKAVMLLGVPEEERDAFVRENGVAEMSTRDLEKAIRQRKQPAPAAPVQQNAPERCESAAVDLDDYIKQRAEEDSIVYDVVEHFADSHFLPAVKNAGNRQAGIDMLKHQLRNSGPASGGFEFSGSAKGIRANFRYERTWTEVWDMLAVIALRRCAAEKAARQEDLSDPHIYLGWSDGSMEVPCHPCRCVAEFKLDGSGTLRRLVRFDGRGWTFDNSSAAVGVTPLRWLELPEPEVE